MCSFSLTKEPTENRPPTLQVPADVPQCVWASFSRLFWFHVPQFYCLGQSDSFNWPCFQWMGVFKALINLLAFPHIAQKSSQISKIQYHLELMTPFRARASHFITSNDVILLYQWPIFVIKAHFPPVLWIFCLQRLVLLTTPSTKLPKTKQEQEKLLAVFSGDGNSLHQRSPPTKDGYFPVDNKESHC